MKTLALLAVVVAAYCYYLRQHPTLADGFSARQPEAASVQPTPRLHYHSPLDASNSHNSSGYYSSEPSEHYETAGRRSTSSRHPESSRDPRPAPQ